MACCHAHSALTCSVGDVAERPLPQRFVGEQQPLCGENARFAVGEILLERGQFLLGRFASASVKRACSPSTSSIG